jgi:hypothetical protein
MAIAATGVAVLINRLNRPEADLWRVRRSVEG